jgi:hypothetical protein
MRRVDYSQIVRGVVALTGQRGDEGSAVDNLSRQDWYALRDVLDLCLGEAWEKDRWPEVMATEELDIIDGVVDLTEAAAAVGQVLAVYDRDPLERHAEEFSFNLIEDDGPKCQVPDATGETVWVEFRKACPELTGDAFDASATYAVGDQQYFSNNFYNCVIATSAGESPTTTPASWELVEIPARFKRYLVAAGIEGWFEGDGQVEKAIAKSSKAANLLEREVIRFRAQEGQARRPMVSSY